MYLSKFLKSLHCVSTSNTNFVWESLYFIELFKNSFSIYGYSILSFLNCNKSKIAIVE